MENLDFMQSNNSECKTCKQNGLNTHQTWMLILAIYILISSVYGTIEMIKGIANFFS